MHTEGKDLENSENLSKVENSNDPNSQTVSSEKSLPEVPTTCCGTGCANCVWIQYVDDLNAYFKDGGKASEEAIDQIEDENIKMLVKMELRARQTQK